MLFKVLTVILVVLVVAEGIYIGMQRHPVNRFKLVSEDGFMAVDTATGQLCRTFAVRKETALEGFGDSDNVKFIRALPACADIR